MNTPHPPGSIVVGLDGSLCSESAAAWAAMLADRRATALHLVHALALSDTAALTRTPFDSYKRRRRQDAEELLTAARATLLTRFPHLWITTEVADGEPVHTLVAHSYAAPLVVVGALGAGGCAGLPLGSVGLRLAAHCACPAVLVREPDRDATDAQGRAIVLGVDPEQPRQAVDFAFDLAAQLDAELRLVRAWHTVPTSTGEHYPDPAMLRTEAEALLGDTVKHAQEDRLAVPRVTASAVSGRPAEVLMRAASDARLLVLGAHRGRPAVSIGVGPVLYALLSRSPCPVAVVPAAWHHIS
jgi:nucleotide-binding universal stress UspA family protein